MHNFTRKKVAIELRFGALSVFGKFLYCCIVRIPSLTGPDKVSILPSIEVQIFITELFGCYNFCSAKLL